MIKIKFLKANNGDAIHISYNKKNIIIDSGTSSTYSFSNRRMKKDGELKNTIKDIKNKQEQIDLFIITHWDDDHIAGILKWFSEDIEEAQSLINKIWFNSGTLINEYFKSQDASTDKTELNIHDSPNTSIRQGITFEKYILDNALSNKEVITTNTDTNDIIDNVKFTILSPRDEELKKLLSLWKKSPYSPNTSFSNDYNKSCKELLHNNFKEDTAIHNGSSIAFILEIEDKKMLFLGDSHPSIIVSRLKKLKYSKNNKLDIEFMKVSHHGSKANTSNELLELIKCNKFIISTNGANHGLPHKETLARIIDNNPKCKLYFNYSELKNKIFTSEELEVASFQVLDVDELEI